MLVCCPSWVNGRGVGEGGKEVGGCGVHNKEQLGGPWRAHTFATTSPYTWPCTPPPTSFTLRPRPS